MLSQERAGGRGRMPSAIIDRFDELPRIKGPKLPRFKDGHYRRIEYLELLGRSDGEEQ